MLGFLVQLIISWLLLWWLQKEHLNALGFTPIGKRSKEFLIGFFSIAILCALIQWVDSAITHLSWRINPELNFKSVASAFGVNVLSVLFEELIFRGALLYILLKRLGDRESIFASAAAFGIYHWFSFGVLGNPVSMSVVFIMTVLPGLAWAYAFTRSRSIMLPIGFHLGWNFVFNAGFGKGPSTIAFLLPVKDDVVKVEGFLSLLNFLLPVVLMPLVCYLIVRLVTSKEPISQ